MTDDELIQTYFRCLNTDDWTTMRTLFTDDGVYEPAGGRPRQGPDAIVEFFPRLFEPWKVHVDSPVKVEILTPGETARADVRFTGTLHDGRQFDFPAEDDFVLRHGKLVSVRTSYDVDAVRRQMAQAAT